MIANTLEITGDGKSVAMSVNMPVPAVMNAVTVHDVDDIAADIVLKDGRIMQETYFFPCAFRAF